MKSPLNHILQNGKGTLDVVETKVRTVTDDEKIEEEVAILVYRGIRAELLDTFTEEQVVNACVYVVCDDYGHSVAKYELDAPEATVKSVKPLYETRRERLDPLL